MGEVCKSVVGAFKKLLSLFEAKTPLLLLRFVRLTPDIRTSMTLRHNAALGNPQNTKHRYPKIGTA